MQRGDQSAACADTEAVALCCWVSQHNEGEINVLHPHTNVFSVTGLNIYFEGFKLKIKLEIKELPETVSPALNTKHMSIRDKISIR